MSFSIRKLEVIDLTNLKLLLREFAEFEKLLDEFLVTEEKLEKVIFGDEAFVECLVGFVDNEMIAFAIFFPIFRTFRGDPSIYLEDLYVKQNHRSKGYGLKMLKAVAKYAKDNGYVRMDWQALNWNTPAIDFYKKLGAESNDEQIDFRLIGEAFEKVAS